MRQFMLGLVVLTGDGHGDEEVDVCLLEVCVFDG
jgi:hypothetical protein